MNSKLIIVLAALLALASVNAQDTVVPALASLSSKIESLSVSATGAGRTPLIQSAQSAYDRISSELLTSGTATAGATSSISSLASESASASMVSSSAASVQSSAASVLSSASSSASAIQSDAASGGSSLIGDGYNALFIQFAALSALFIASFVAMLA